MYTNTTPRHSPAADSHTIPHFSGQHISSQNTQHRRSLSLPSYARPPHYSRSLPPSGSGCTHFFQLLTHEAFSFTLTYNSSPSSASSYSRPRIHQHFRHRSSSSSNRAAHDRVATGDGPAERDKPKCQRRPGRPPRGRGPVVIPPWQGEGWR